MTLYLDSSALVKLYIEEENSAIVRKAVEEADDTATCVVTYAEARAALARRRRESALKEAGYRTAVEALDEDWRAFTRLEVNDGLARLAGVLAEQKSLRGFDAVHLAAALTLQQQVGDVAFMAFDKRLVEAAGGLLPVVE